VQFSIYAELKIDKPVQTVLLNFYTAAMIDPIKINLISSDLPSTFIWLRSTPYYIRVTGSDVWENTVWNADRITPIMSEG